MKSKLLFVMLALVVTFAACTEDKALEVNEINPQSVELKTASLKGFGQFKIAFKSKPGADFDEAGAYLNYIDLVSLGKHKKETKRVNIWNTGEDFNLLEMETGILGDIGFLIIPSGSYDYADVTVTEGWASKDGVTYPVKFPGHKMILWFRPPVIVGEHLSPDIDINIDVSKSFVAIKNRRGETKGYVFKPIVRVKNNTSTGSLVGGVVDPQISPIGGAHVFIQAGEILYETYSLESYFIDEMGIEHFPGEYWIPGIPAGTYTAFVSADGFSTASEEVTIIEGNFNSQNFVMIPQ